MTDFSGGILMKMHYDILAAVRGDAFAGQVIAEFAHPCTIVGRCMRYEQTHFSRLPTDQLHGLQIGNHMALPKEPVVELCNGEVVRTADKFGDGPVVSRQRVTVIVVSSVEQLRELRGRVLLVRSNASGTAHRLHGNTFEVSRQYPGQLWNMVSVLHHKCFSTAPKPVAPALQFVGALA